MELMPRFRCERCGYDLSTLSATTLCQECGTPVDDSRPERRPGVPWQQFRSISSWLATLAFYIHSPLKIFRVVRVETASMRRLLLVNLVVSSILCLVPSVIVASYGRRHLTIEIATNTPNAIVRHVIMDSYPVLVFVLTFFLGPVSLLTIWIAARWAAPRKSPPLAPAVAWVSGGLSSLSFVIAIGASLVLWLIRYGITPTAIDNAASSDITWWSIITGAPVLAFLALLLVGAMIDFKANRWNRLANSLDQLP
jgi:hypothetical protein